MGSRIAIIVDLDDLPPLPHPAIALAASLGRKRGASEVSSPSPVLQGILEQRDCRLRVSVVRQLNRKMQ